MQWGKWSQRSKFLHYLVGHSGWFSPATAMDYAMRHDVWLIGIRRQEHDQFG